MRVRLVILSFFGLVSPFSHSQPTDLPRLIDPPKTSDAYLYAESTAYSMDSARAAYVSTKLMAAYTGLRHNEQQEVVEIRLRDAFEEGMKDVKGLSFDDLAKKIGNMSGTLGTIVTTKYPQYGTALSGAGKIVEWTLPLFNTPPIELKSSYESVAAANAIALANMNNKTSLGKYLTDAQVTFRPDLNPNMEISHHPIVKKEHEKISATEVLRKIKASVDETRKEARNYASSNSDKLAILGDQVTMIADSFNKFIMTDFDRAKLKKLEDEKELRREKAAATFGSLHLLGRIANDQALVNLANNGASLSESAFRLMEADFSNNPAAATNAYLFAANCLFSMMSSGSQRSQMQAMMEQLQIIQKLLIDLGKRMDQRFDHIDKTLHRFVQDTAQRLNQVVSNAQMANQLQEETLRQLKTIQMNSFGSYVFLSATKMNEITHNCFTKWQYLFSAAEFVRCRDDIALFAIVGPPLPKSESPLNLNRNLIGSLQERLIPIVGNSPALPGNDPRAWLTSVKLLHELGLRYPQHAHLLKMDTYNAATSVRAKDIQDIGRYYQTLFRRMAVDTGKLRRDLISDLITAYKLEVEKAIEHTDKLPEAKLRGAPPFPMKETYKQYPPMDPKLYEFVENKLSFCDPKRPNIDLSARSFNPRQRFPYLAMQKKWLTEKSEISFDRSILDIVDKSVLFAATSELKDAKRWGINLSACIEKLSVKSYVRRIDSTPLFIKGVLGTRTLRYIGDSEIYLEIVLKAKYFFKGKLKDLTVLRLTRQDSFEGKPVIATITPFERIWMHSYWAGNFPSRDDSFYQEREIFDTGRPLRTNLKYMVPFTPDLNEFHADFKEEMENSVKQPINYELNNKFSAYNVATDNAREQLSLILNYGIEVDSPEMSALVSWIALPGNLPNAAAWARFQYERGLSANDMKEILAQRLEVLRQLISRVEASSVKPGPIANIFDSALKTFNTDAGLPN